MNDLDDEEGVVELTDPPRPDTVLASLALLETMPFALGRVGCGARCEEGSKDETTTGARARTREELVAAFKDLPRSFLKLPASDTATELTAPFRSTEERRLEFAQIEAASDRDAALRVMDSEKDWGTGWAVALDEWQAARALGASESASKMTRDELKLKGTGLSPTELNAFRARVALLHRELRKENPDGTIMLYRGIKGFQAKRVTAAVGDDVELGVHGLSSWSLYPSTAAQFAGKRGRVLQTLVDVDDVWMTGEHAMAHQVLRMSDQHGEYVIKTASVSRRARVVR